MIFLLMFALTQQNLAISGKWQLLHSNKFNITGRIVIKFISMNSHPQQASLILF